MTFRFAFLATALTTAMAAALAVPAAQAQVTPKAFAITAYALDAKTLSGANMRISLWGVDQPDLPGTSRNLLARVELDDFINGGVVTCTPKGAPVNGTLTAQCLNAQEQDIALYLISRGLVATKRYEIIGSDIANAYMSAERRARDSGLGLWAQGTGQAPASAAIPATGSSFTIPGVATDIPMWLLAATLLLVPMFGFFVIGVILRSGFSQLAQLQKYQLAGTQKRERALKEREKFVIASALESEINANRAKLDAFLVIYEELMKTLRDPSKKPKYQRAGDIIHEKPALARTVYDAHVGKIEILGPQIGADLEALYQHVSATPDYRTLEPDVPIEKAREVVDRILKNAMKLSDPMDKALAALGVIVRDKRGVS